MHSHMAATALLAQLQAQFTIGPHAAGDDQPFQAGGLEGEQGLAHQDLDDGRLGRGRQIGPHRLAGRIAESLQLRPHGGLESGEGKVKVVAAQ